MGLWVLVALINPLISRELLTFAYSRAAVRYHLWHARKYAIGHESWFNKLFNGI